MSTSVPPAGRPSNRPGSERRRDARAPIELKVEYKRLNSFFADYTKNISKDGTFIATSKPLPIGTEFMFKLTVPSMDEPFALKGQVSWIVMEAEETADRPAGMGIKFRYDDEADRARVHDAVWALLVASLGEHVARRLMESSEPDPQG